MMKLYDSPLSGNCHKVRLLMSLLDLEYESVPINMAEMAHKTPDYVAINPLGQVPVLDDDGEVIRDSQAILVYLAAKFGDGRWLPKDDPYALGHVSEWLSFSANEMSHGCAASRALVLFNRDGDLEGARTLARKALGILDDHLAAREWLVGDAPTVADIANYVYAGLVHQGGINPHEFTNVSTWLGRVEALEGYIGMAALPAPK
ncbi:MAG: glutathione S-transferase family protein [Rhodospirillaceae bacterium]|jgi:glutathione S-transferase|nr:glutathione S-transferase family protein [Rhodospirillaceae bacterium]